MEHDPANVDDHVYQEYYQEVSKPIRDTALITNLCLNDNAGSNVLQSSLYTASSNGSIREWSLCDDGLESMPHLGTMWEHSTWVNDIRLSPPTEGMCIKHGILCHACLLYSISDDRTIRMWDTITRRQVDEIHTPNIKGSTPFSLALGDRHLFVGNSIGTIWVYPLKKDACERSDFHICLEVTPGKRSEYCLQATLKHGETECPILALEVGGVNHSMKYLFSGKQDGTVAIFALDQGGLNFEMIAQLNQVRALYI
mmetsp:Transcript_38248/g.57255  ORF Transcript_38248/g.57255 Transcript_38248/m.57255 type:complete len:255 (-) Transcript_38248:69-833(-)